MSVQNKLHKLLSMVGEEDRTGRILAHLGSKGDLRSVAISVRDGEIVHISDSKANREETGFWNLPVRSAILIPRDNLDAAASGDSVIELPVLLRLLQEGGTIPREGRRTQQTEPAAAPSPPTVRVPMPAPIVEKAEAPEKQTRALWELSQAIDKAITKKGLDITMTRGKIGLAAGVLLDFDENTPDDDEIFAMVRSAAESILGKIAIPSKARRGSNNLMSALKKIDRIIEKKGLDSARIKGEIGLKAGMFIDFDDDSPDDIQLANRILVAAREVLGEVLQNEHQI